MKIAIIGYGKMGHEIEKAAKSTSIIVKSIIDPNNEESQYREINEKSLNGIDVCIDFTSPESVLQNIKKISALKKNIVVGTTGWYNKLTEAKKIVEKSKIGLIYASNFSLGVNIFFRILENSSKIINKFDDYDIYSYELHHKMKIDSPSGTAKTIGEILIKNINRKKNLVYERLNRQIKPNEIHISSIRAGFIPGTHVIGFDSSSDTIVLKHTARNREGFAKGALIAAKWIQNKKGFYTINDMMDKNPIK